MVNSKKSTKKEEKQIREIKAKDTELEIKEDKAGEFSLDEFVENRFVSGKFNINELLLKSDAPANLENSIVNTPAQTQTEEKKEDFSVKYSENIYEITEKDLERRERQDQIRRVHAEVILPSNIEEIRMPFTPNERLRRVGMVRDDALSFEHETGSEIYEVSQREDLTSKNPLDNVNEKKDIRKYKPRI